MKNKLIIQLFVLILFLGVLAIIIFNENGLLKYIKVRNELVQMEKQIKLADEKLSSLEREIDSLQVSKSKIEQVAREKYHMMKKTERAFIVEEK